VNAARQLGPEMVTEGWQCFGGDSLLWCHPPSRRVIVVDGPMQRSLCSLPDYPGELVSANACCYAVVCYRAGEFGSISQPPNLDGFRTGSYGEAVRIARETRARILSERRSPMTARQMTLDEYLEAHHG